MGLRFDRQDAQLGAIPAGVYVTNTSTTPPPLDLPNRAVDWGVLPSGTAGYVLTVNADGSIGWAAGGIGSGTVTSVSWTGDGTIFTASADTPVTTTGTLTPASLIAQAKNTFLAGPATGSNAAPTFRALAAADLPAGTGTVTSVSWTGDGTIFTASADTPVTTTGTLTPASLIAQAKNTFLAGPSSGSNATPTFRALAAADLPLTQSYGASTVTLQTNSGYAFNFISNINLEPNYSAAGNSGVLIDTYSQGGTLSYPLGFRTPAGSTVPIMFLGKNSSTMTNRGCGYIDANFNTSTDASWSGNLYLYAGDYTSSNAGKRLGFQVQSNGSAALIGHYGATPVVQPVGGGGNTSMVAGTGTAVLAGSTFTGASGSSTYTIGDIVTALKALGLLTA